MSGADAHEGAGVEAGTDENKIVGWPDTRAGNGNVGKSATVVAKDGLPVLGLGAGVSTRAGGEGDALRGSNGRAGTRNRGGDGGLEIDLDLIDGELVDVEREGLDAILVVDGGGDRVAAKERLRVGGADRGEVGEDGIDDSVAGVDLDIGEILVGVGRGRVRVG